MTFDGRAQATGAHDSRFLPRRAAPISILVLSAIFAGSWPCRAKNATPAAVPRFTNTNGQSYYANAHPYVEEPLDLLVHQMPELKTLQPAPDQQALLTILSKAAAKVDEFFRQTVDLVAQEEITQEKLSPKGSIKSSQRGQYNYLILHHRDGPVLRLEEYRTDSKGDRVEDIGFDKGYSATSGFALTCIHFASDHRSDSTFRYLGDEMVGTRNTYVVAFAQRPGQAVITDMASGVWGTVIILVQGIAWIDKDNFQIIQMRTDLLAPRGDVGLDEETTVVTFGPVRVANIDTSFWLPTEVSVYSKFRGQAYRNEHHYTNFKRYRVAVEMVTPQ